jgi:nitroreductase
MLIDNNRGRDYLCRYLELKHMDRFSNLIATRRSMRKFTEEKLTEEQKRTILRAALISPTAKNNRGWEFVAIDDPAVLEKLSKSREMGSGFLAEAVFAVVVLGDPSKTDCWVEDCSIAAIDMQLQAEDLGLGSCWCHMRGRSNAEGKTTKQTIIELLGVPEQYEPLCIVGVGHKNMDRKPYEDDKIEWSKVHWGKF